jgi:hypothetical protein
MKSLLSFCVFLNLLPQISFTQNEPYHLNFVENTLKVTTSEDTIIFKKTFSHPFIFSSDLDGDNLEEILVIDSLYNIGDTNFILYVFNTLDSMYLADSINSGSVYPYVAFPGEIEGLIIVSGNPDFSYLSANRQDLNDGSKMKTLPVNCWKFEDGEIFLVNRELYEIFVNENEAILSTIENFQSDYSDNCAKSKAIKSLIASAYINYLNAGENASAENFLKTFYQCDDFENFKKELDNLFYKENE